MFEELSRENEREWRMGELGDSDWDWVDTGADVCAHVYCPGLLYCEGLEANKRECQGFGRREGVHEEDRGRVGWIR